MFRAYAEAVSEHKRLGSWSNTEELLATVVDLLMAIHALLSAGIPVVHAKNARKPKQVSPYPRPDWVRRSGDEADVVVMRPRELAKKMRGRRHG